MSTELSPRQRDVLNFIVRKIQTRGFPPTIREIRDAMGLKSLRGVTIHLDALERKGFIKRSSQARGIQVVRTPCEGESQGFIRVPLLGEIHAGTPLGAEGDIEGYVDVRKERLKGARNAFLLRVKGDSMAEEGIYDGDLAIISFQATAEAGDIVVALSEDGVALKKLHRVGDYVASPPGNPNHETKIEREFSIQGKLIGVIRGEKREDKARLTVD